MDGTNLFGIPNRKHEKADSLRTIYPELQRINNVIVLRNLPTHETIPSVSRSTSVKEHNPELKKWKNKISVMT